MSWHKIQFCIVGCCLIAKREGIILYSYSIGNYSLFIYCISLYILSLILTYLKHSKYGRIDIRGHWCTHFEFIKRVFHVLQYYNIIQTLLGANSISIISLFFFWTHFDFSHKEFMSNINIYNNCNKRHVTLWFCRRIDALFYAKINKIK